MMTMSFENTVFDHSDVTPVAFWTNAMLGWTPLAKQFVDMGEVGNAEFYNDLADAAEWLVGELLLDAVLPHE